MGVAALPLSGDARAQTLRAPVVCDRQCLYKVLDGYLAALKRRDPSGLRWAAQVKNTENNVELRVGDGLWGTITGLDAYEISASRIPRKGRWRSSACSRRRPRRRLCQRG
jgi:hypothetical protein